MAIIIHAPLLSQTKIGGIILSIVYSTVSAYEEQYSKAPSEKATHFIETVCKIGEKLVTIGKHHARGRHTPMESDFFQQLVSCIDDPETAHSIAGYYQDCYQDGYTQGRL